MSKRVVLTDTDNAEALVGKNLKQLEIQQVYSDPLGLTCVLSNIVSALDAMLIVDLLSLDGW